MTVGLKVGVGYRLRVTGIPERPGVEVFPAVEIVGHLHRPAGADPGKFPIRIVFALDDLYDAADRVRLITQVVYLEDPDQALPVKLGKDEPPSVALNPAEDPLKVASALGRVMAIVRLGARRPMPQEMGQPIADDLPRGGCPFTTSVGARCALPCGPVCGTPPPIGKPWLPRDEYLCDGGDRGMPLHFEGEGGLRGIDPRDALVTFNTGDRPRILPTNTVCLYAPRFASVRTSIGPNESLSVTGLAGQESRQSQAEALMRQGPKRLLQQSSAETSRHRARASGLASRVFAGEHSELRVLSGYDNASHLAGRVLVQGPEKIKGRVKMQGNRGTERPIAMKTAESAVITGIIEGAGQTVMTWTPRETVGVEVPPNKPGLTVIKQVSAADAEPGDVVTFTIRFKNMGNTPIRAVSIVDSLMPRLEYVPKTALGPAGTVFTAGREQGVVARAAMGSARGAGTWGRRVRLVSGRCALSDQYSMCECVLLVPTLCVGMPSSTLRVVRLRR